MFKFLRKYNKYILAVGGTLLLITFLIPYAFTNLLQGTAAGRGTWATVGIEKQHKVSYRELTRLQRELRLLDAAGSALQLPVDVDTADYWYLLTLEAQDAGVIPAPVTIATTEQQAQQVAILAAMSGENLPFARQTLAKVQGVHSLFRLYIDGDKYSDRRLKQLARRLYHRVTVLPLVIEASAEGSGDYTEEQLAEQLEKYADDEPGAGEMGFGYKLPDRAGLEWIAVPVESVREMIRNSDQLNAVALRKHWRLNEERFTAPEPGAPVPDEVREDLLEELTRDTLDQIERTANDKLRFARRGLGMREGYEVLPEGWQGLSFEELALALQDEFKIALPRYASTGDRLLTAEQLGELEGVGSATSDKFGQTPVDLATFVMGAQTLGHSPMIPIQIGIAGPPLRGADGSIYFFRLTATDAARAPTSVDEVREQLVNDLNRLANYQRLVDGAPSMRQVAITDGMLALAMEHDVAIGDQTGVTLGFSSKLPGIGVNQKAVETIVDHAMGLPQDVAVADLPEPDRVLAIPVPENLSLLVVRLMAQTPLTQQTFQTYMQYGLVQNKLLSEEVSQDEPAAEFSYDALVERHGFKLVHARETEKDETSEPDQPPAEAGLR